MFFISLIFKYQATLQKIIQIYNNSHKNSQESQNK